MLDKIWLVLNIIVGISDVKQNKKIYVIIYIFLKNIVYVFLFIVNKNLQIDCLFD